jgi:hypothetical protein
MNETSTGVLLQTLRISLVGMCLPICFVRTSSQSGARGGAGASFERIIHPPAWLPGCTGCLKMHAGGAPAEGSSCISILIRYLPAAAERPKSSEGDLGKDEKGEGNQQLFIIPSRFHVGSDGWVFSSVSTARTAISSAFNSRQASSSRDQWHHVCAVRQDG